MTENTSTSNRQPQATGMADEIDLQKLFGLLLDHRWLIIGTTLIALFLGVAYGLLATPSIKPMPCCKWKTNRGRARLFRAQRTVHRRILC